MRLQRLLLVLLAACTSTSAGAQRHNIDSLVADEMRRQHIAGLSLGVVKNGEVIVSKGYGFANLSDSTPATEYTTYRLASLSKELIAVNVMRLAAAGKLGLHDPIRKYIPDVPAAWRPITIRNLLNHTSGLERESPVFNWGKKQPDSVLIRAAYNDPLLFTPGTDWSYSNLGYFIIADIIRRVTDTSFEDYMDHFLAGCGLQHTATTAKSTGLAGTRGYRYDEASGAIVPAKDIVTFRASSAVASCIADLLQWDAMIGKSNILSGPDWRKMWEDLVVEKERSDGGLSYYGYGWGMRRYRGHRLLVHSGSNPGFENQYWKFIDDGTSIIILTNADKCNSARIAAEIYALLHLMPQRFADKATD